MTAVAGPGVDTGVDTGVEAGAGIGDEKDARPVVVTRTPPGSGSDLVLGGVLLALVVGAVVSVRTGEVDGYGMWSAVGPLWWIAGSVAVVTGMVTLRRDDRPGTWLRRSALGSWFVLIHAIEPLTAPNGRFAVSWLHLGFGKELVDNGPSRLLDARFSWPGFLGVLGAATERGGASSADWLVRLWPLMMMAAWAGLTTALAVRAFPDRPTVARLTPWIFLGVSWTGQDYLSPQSVSFAAAMVVVLVLTQPRGATWPGWAGAWLHTPVPMLRRWESSDVSGEGAALFVAALVSMAVIVSHPLTPFFLVAWVIVLALAGYRRARGLAPLMLMAYLAWMSYGARPFWAGVLPKLLGDVGDISSSIDAGTTERIGVASEARSAVLMARYSIVLAIMVLSFVAVITARRRGRRSAIPLASLAVVLVPAIALQSYGGEMLIRVFLFAAPIGAVLVADLFVSLGSRLGTIAAGIVLAGLLPLMLLGRWGNESYEATFDSDVATMRDVYAEAGRSTVVLSTNSFLPWRYTHATLASGAGAHRIAGLVVDDGWVSSVTEYSRNLGADHVIVVLTRSTKAYEQEVRGVSAETIDEFVQMLQDSPDARVVSRHGDAIAIEFPVSS